MFKVMKEKPRGQLIAQGSAVVGFAVLTILAIANDNVVFAPIFFLLGLYYLRKMVKQENRSAAKVPDEACTAAKPEDAKAELAQMLQYYKRLLKNWQWIALFGWVLSITLLVYAPSLVIVITIGLAAYSTYAFIRCRQAVQRIETSPSFGGEGRIRNKLV